MIDPKPVGRVRDPALLKSLHKEWQECALCYGTQFSEGRLSLHHIHKHPRDDVRGNLVMLCGDGVMGCHGRVEAHDPVAMRLLGEHIVDQRPDVVAYLVEQRGETGASAWIFRQYRVSIL